MNEKPSEFARKEIERLFGSVDPEYYRVAWFEDGDTRRTFTTYVIRGPDPFGLELELIRCIRHDHAKPQGWEISDVDSKNNCRLAWRMYPEIDQDEDGSYRICCRLVWWVAEKVTA